MPEDVHPPGATDDPGRLPQVTASGPVHRAASRLLRRERRLLTVPAVAAVGSVAVIPAARVGSQVFSVLFAVLVEAVGGTFFAIWGETWGTLYLAIVPYLAGVAVVLAAVTAVVAWCNLGLVAATDAVRRGEEASLVRAMAMATLRLPNALVVGVLVGGTLLLPWLAERSTRDRHRWRFARLFGGTYTAARFLVAPAAVLDGAGPVDAFRRSHGLLADRFGSPVMVRIGAVRRYGAVGFAVSLAAALGVSVVALLAGASPSVWLGRDAVVVAVLAPLWVGVVYGSAVGAVVKALLYVALRDDHERLPVVDAPVADAVRVIRPDDG